MKKWTEGVAALMAILTSGAVLGGTFGLARFMEARSVSHSPAFVSNAKLSMSAVPLSAEASQGRHLFQLNCAHCHGDDAHGDEGPDLYNLHKSDARIRAVITGGIKGEMPSFAKKLNDSDVNALTAYLRTLRS
jgi:mono/diheme cytochrome c family protein